MKRLVVEKKAPRRRSMTIAGSILTTLAIVTSCASQPEDLQTAYISPVKYVNYDCQQIAMEADAVQTRTAQLYQNLKRKANTDAWQMGVGLVLLWPVLFTLEGGDGPEAAEYSRLTGEYAALQTAAVESRCTNLPPLDQGVRDKVETVEARAPAQGTRPPAVEQRHVYAERPVALSPPVTLPAAAVVPEPVAPVSQTSVQWQAQLPVARTAYAPTSNDDSAIYCVVFSKIVQDRANSLSAISAAGHSQELQAMRTAIVRRLLAGMSLEELGERLEPHTAEVEWLYGSGHATEAQFSRDLSLCRSVAQT
jgi:hypothetical protein